VELDNYEATSTFTSVTTQIVAHPAIRGFVDGLQKATFPSPPAIQATGLPAFTPAGLPPASACSPSLGTQLLLPDPRPSNAKIDPHTRAETIFAFMLFPSWLSRGNLGVEMDSTLSAPLIRLCGPSPSCSWMSRAPPGYISRKHLPPRF